MLDDQVGADFGFQIMEDMLIGLLGIFVRQKASIDLDGTEVDRRY